MSRRVEENPPIDATLRDYYGVRPSVAAYVQNSPDEIQGDLFSFVAKRPNVTMMEVSKLAMDMMQSYMEMASSKGLAAPEPDVYYQFEDGWFIKELKTSDDIDDFQEAFTGSVGFGDNLYLKHHIKNGGILFGVFDNGFPVAFIKGEPVSNTGRYKVYEIVPRTEDVVLHLAGFFNDEEYKFKLPVSWSMWATEHNGQQFDFSDLCNGVSTTTQLARAISNMVYGRDKFNLFRNIISIPYSHLMERTLNCLLKFITPNMMDYQVVPGVDDVAFILAATFVLHDKLRARQWSVAEAKKQGHEPFGGPNELSGGELALEHYLKDEYNRSSFSWLIRRRAVVLEDIYDLPEFEKFASTYGSKPDPKYYKGDSDGYHEALDMWADAKAEARENWVEGNNSLSVILFDMTINAYCENVKNYANLRNVLSYMSQGWKHSVKYTGPLDCLGENR